MNFDWMKEEDLKQTIVFFNPVLVSREKSGILIVGIADSLKEALNQYTDIDHGNMGTQTSLAVDIILEKFEIIQDMLYKHSYDDFHPDKPSVRMKAITQTWILSSDLAKKKRSDLCKSSPNSQKHLRCVQQSQKRKMRTFTN